MRLGSVEGLAQDEFGTEEVEPVPITPTRRRIAVRVAGKVVLYAVLVVAAIVSISPFLWMISTSLKAESQLFSFPPEWIPNPVRFSNYVDMAQAFPILRQLFNSVFVTVTVSFGQVLFCSLAGYSFARLRFPGRDKLFMIYLGTLMVPFMVTLVPSYALMRYFGWIDTYYALIVPFFFGNAYGTFLMRQFFMTLPRELEEAAHIDGAGPFRIYWQIFLPMVRPALATLAVFSVLFFWNDFLWPLLVTQSDEIKTLPVGLASFQGLYGSRFNLLMAGATVAVLPMLAVFIAAQRYFIEGINLGGMKL
jgi:multiple sugar transport system permease protein